MSYTTVEIHIPEAMKPYITENNAEDELQRNALLLYPYVLQKKISNGRAAEILGISKLDLQKNVLQKKSRILTICHRMILIVTIGHSLENQRQPFPATVRQPLR